MPALRSTHWANRQRADRCDRPAARQELLGSACRQRGTAGACHVQRRGRRSRHRAGTWTVEAYHGAVAGGASDEVGSETRIEERPPPCFSNGKHHSSGRVLGFSHDGNAREQACLLSTLKSTSRSGAECPMKTKAMTCGGRISHSRAGRFWANAQMTVHAIFMTLAERE
jgi:hypothetical protein